jgi:hypothetical protein
MPTIDAGWEETGRAKSELWRRGGNLVGKKLKLVGKWCGTAAEEGGVYELIEDRDFARLALVGGEEGDHM